ncbi:hypothetical protein BN2537_17085 [Streptomyces venezuelae]|nr:hypothetical protein BN2537_17085 [Streptomyces venezuelae]
MARGRRPRRGAARAAPELTAFERVRSSRGLREPFQTTRGSLRKGSPHLR